MLWIYFKGDLLMINIHNIMEEQVISRINELYDQVMKKGSPWLTCDCENCRLDTISYVLNRIQPRYVVSGRGVTHNTAAILADTQIAADIDRLGLDGMKMVSTAKRPYHKSAKLNANKAPELKTPVFNFPTFIGNVYDGSTFEPLIGARVFLKENENLAEMMDASWANPCKTFSSTNGSYTFWLAPKVAMEEKENQEFTFTIEVIAEGYTSAIYTFSVPLVSEKNDRRELNSTYSLKIQDLFLFRTDIINEQE